MGKGELSAVYGGGKNYSVPREWKCVGASSMKNEIVPVLWKP